MAQKTDSELITEAGVIKDETSAGANTATRVGEMLEDIIDSKVNNDYIIATDGGTSTELKNDRLSYYYSGNQKSIDLIFPVDPLENTQIEIPNVSTSGTLAMVEKTEVYDMGNGNYIIQSDGIYEFSNCINILGLPDPTLFNGKKITIINADDTNALVINSNNPFWLGSDNQITQIGPFYMYIFVSINGKWRGGYLMD